MKKRLTLLKFAIVFVALVAAYIWRPSTSTQDLASHPMADQIVIEKAQRHLSLFSKGELIKTYTVSLGTNPIGPKVQRGDGKTPEGSYHIVEHNHQSKFFLSLRVSYPEKKDILAAKALGVDPGSDIMIHGLQNGLGWLGPYQSLWNWTDGCIAVTDQEITEIAAMVPDGTKVEIEP